MIKLLLWLFIGGTAGWLAGVITKGKGFGCLGNVVVGVVGSVVGGWLFGLLRWGAPGNGLVGSIITAFIGAVTLIVVIKLVLDD